MFFCNSNYRPAVSIVFTLILGLTSILFPHGGDYRVFYLITGIYSCSATVWEVAHNAWLAEMWNKKVAPILQFSEFIYALGFLLGPFGMTFFVTDELSNEQLVKLGDNSTALPTGMDRQKKVAVPFAFAGCMHVAVFVVLWALHRYQPYVKKERKVMKRTTVRKMVPSETDPTNVKVIVIETIEDGILEVTPLKRHIYLAFIALAVGIYDCTEANLLTFYPTMLRYIPSSTSQMISASKASWLFTLMGANYAAGRLVSSLVSMFVSCTALLIGHLTIVLIALIGVFITLSQGQHDWLLYCTTGMLGFGFSAVMPAFNAFAEHHFGLSDRTASMFTGSTNIMILLFLVLFEENNSTPIHLLTFSGGFITIAFILFVIIRLILPIPRKI